ncbi:MAG: hypothetical protein FWG65_02745 [Turicibacter sp.]|nr:hypothetical protein [Turicibacter sp.]
MKTFKDEIHELNIWYFERSDENEKNCTWTPNDGRDCGCRHCMQQRADKEEYQRRLVAIKAKYTQPTQPDSAKVLELA